MHIIPASAFRTQPWKNGGGVTHEIAREDAGDRLLWRLSVAEVASDGPFSAFPGLARILTVIEGAGLHLDTPEGRLDALPFTPTGFSGDLPVNCRRIAGPVRDLNVIHDPERIAASVRILDGTERHESPPVPGRRYAILATGPRAVVDGTAIPPGAVGFFEHGTAQATTIFPAILVIFEQIPT
ncbi:HutD/Ves family protein [Defluviimonas sp. SAOS-178_SWC]|uniref:HutD/Ves family protein n=1 Tax=Defluviimonas sp. SAOS-178_SWC TaxID=3121287 RepID=UPI0032220BF2